MGYEVYRPQIQHPVQDAASKEGSAASTTWIHPVVQSFLAKARAMVTTVGDKRKSGDDTSALAPPPTKAKGSAPPPSKSTQPVVAPSCPATSKVSPPAAPTSNKG